MERKFYDLNVSLGENILEIIERAEKLDLSGLCLVSNIENLEDNLKKIDKLRKKTDLDLISGVLLKENIEKMARNIRPKVEVILVSGGNYDTNRAACSSDYVDILCHPERGRPDCGIDHICCREAREHNTIIELNFRELLLSSGMDRIKELNKMKEIVRLCLKTKTKFIVNSGAFDKYELRGGRELSSLSFALGANIYDALVSNSDMAEELVKRNRTKLKQPLPGVEMDY